MGQSVLLANTKVCIGWSLGAIVGGRAGTRRRRRGCKRSRLSSPLGDTRTTGRTCRDDVDVECTSTWIKASWITVASNSLMAAQDTGSGPMAGLLFPLETGGRPSCRVSPGCLAPGRCFHVCRVAGFPGRCHWIVSMASADATNSSLPTTTSTSSPLPSHPSPSIRRGVR